MLDPGPLLMSLPWFLGNMIQNKAAEFSCVHEWNNSTKSLQLAFILHEVQTDGVQKIISLCFLLMGRKDTLNICH